MEIANDIIYTMPRVKLRLSMYLCHFRHAMNAITELLHCNYLLVAQNSFLSYPARNLIR